MHRTKRRAQLLGKSRTGMLLLGMLWLILSHCGGNDDSGSTDKGSGSPFLFAVISDTHILTDENELQDQIFSYTVQVMNEHTPPIDFLVLTGDSIDRLPSDDPDYYNEHTDTALEQLMRLASGLTMPMYLVMGNHDYYTGGLLPIPSRHKEAREQLYIEKGLLPAPYYAFEHRGVRFYCLNSMQQDPLVRWEPNAVGTLGPEQASWFSEQLSDGKPAFIFIHHPLATDVTTRAGISSLTPFEIPRAEGNFPKYRIGPYSKYTDPIYAILEGRNRQVRAVFFGHAHLFLRDEYEGIPIFMTDSMKLPSLSTYEGRPMRYYIVECQSNTGDFSVYNEYMIPYFNE